MKKTLCALLTLAMLMGMIAALPAAASEAPVEISVAMWSIEESVEGRGKDAVLDTIESKTGVKIIPQNVTWDDYTDKLVLWAASGSLPDVFAGAFIGTAYYGQWVNQGVLHALPDDLSAYPNLKAYLEGSARAQGAVYDGKYYMIPRQTYMDISSSVLDRNIIYRWDLAQKAGVTKEPTTVYEFKDMMVKIIAADPDGTKVSGITQVNKEQILGIFMPYGGIVEKKWVYKDGQFMPSYFAGDLLASFQLARDWYESGVVEQDIALASDDMAPQKFLQGSAAGILRSGGPKNLYGTIGKEWQELYGYPMLDAIKVAPIFPDVNGDKTYWVDTEAWSESYVSGAVSDTKLAAICGLFDYLFSDEGRYLTYFGVEGEDYELIDGHVSLLHNTSLSEKYPAFKGITMLATWKPSDNPKYAEPDISGGWSAVNEARRLDAVNNGVLPKYYDSVLFLSTPLKDEFVFNPTDDTLAIMMGSEPVEKMYADLMARYEAKGLSAMLKEVNEYAATLGIEP